MPELAYNILWAWEPSIRTLFRRLDPGALERVGIQPGGDAGPCGAVDARTRRHRPAVPCAVPARLPAIRRAYAQAARRTAGGKLVAYFSAEYGLTECMPVYSGGLGVLSGDHMKSASDIDLPLVGVALLYQLGYFRQYLNADGWQQERYLENDFYSLPIQPALRRERQSACRLRADADRAGRDSHLDHGRGPRPDAVPRYQHAGEQPAGRPRHHQPALRRRQRYAHPPGDRAGHRRHARARNDGHEADRFPHERRPFRVPRN